MRLANNSARQRGFNLIEMTIVFVILGFLLAAALLPLQAQRSIAAQLKTEAILANAKIALIGFAQAHGRLPCPATNNGTAIPPDDTGTANPNASDACVAQVGFLPAKTLGLQSIDAQGYALDAWQNRIRYAVTNVNNSAFTKTNGMNDLGVAALAPNFRVCTSAAAVDCLVENAVVVIFSLGATANQPSGGIDEGQNLTVPVNTVFVSHTMTTATSANGEFDHMVTWLSPYILYNAMIMAGQLH